MWAKIVVGQANADQAVGLVVRLIQAPHLIQGLVKQRLGLLILSLLQGCPCRIGQRSHGQCLVAGVRRELHAFGIGTQSFGVLFAGM